ncbi:hypothetical protein LTR98_001932 [Exophiala xenobiotica]|nr:hypothetical protein LTR98_001932 [Exophiala xenobiotica]
MAPSSTTPNFSRPFPSPLTKGDFQTPVIVPRPRRVFASPHTPASQENMGQLGQGNAKTLSPGQVLFDVTNSGSPIEGKLAGDEVKGGSNAGSPETMGRHNRDSSAASLKTDSPLTVLSADLGGINKPIPNFRPHLWTLLDTERETLNLDLFWPIKLEDIASDEDEDELTEDGDPKGVFPFKELQPLKTFRNLHYLQLNGMMRSYQPIIWATCWQNKNLTKVHLEMALEPLFCPDIAHKYRKIDVKWTFNRLPEPSTEIMYLGAHGAGVLHEEFGDGEYLDQQAMKASQLDDVKNLPIENVRYLPITHLTLMNFVVDAGPFYRWFDPKKFKEVTFKGDCIDAGFNLPQEMVNTVTVKSPKPLPPPRWVKPGEVKLIDIKKRPTPTATDTNTKDTKADAVLGAGHGLKSKISQMMPKWGSKGKDGKEQDGTQDTAQLESNMKKMGL